MSAISPQFHAIMVGYGLGLLFLLCFLAIVLIMQAISMWMTKTPREEVFSNTTLPLLAAARCAQEIAEKKVRVGEDWMKINPALFRVVYMHYSELVSSGETKRLTTIIVRGVRPGTKIPRILAKLEDSIIPLGFKREEIKVSVEAQK